MKIYNLDTTRKLDDLGRLVIPKETCRDIGVKERGAIYQTINGSILEIRKEWSLTRRAVLRLFGIRQPGVRRHIDDLSRCVIIKDYRKKNNVREGDQFLIHKVDKTVLIRLAEQEVVA